MKLSELASYPRSVKLYLLSCATFGLGTGIYELVFNLHLLRLGLNAEDIGNLYLVNFVTMCVLAIPAGKLADRHGRKAFLVTASLMFGLTMTLIPWTANYWGLMSLQVANSIAAIVMFTTENSTIASEVSVAQRTQLFSFVYINYLVWDGVGTLLGGLLPQWLPRGQLTEFQTTLFVSGVVCVGIGVLRAAMRLKPEAIESDTTKPSGDAPTLFGVTSRPFAKMAALAFFVGAAATLAMRFINVVLDERYAMGTEAISILLVIEKIISFAGAAVAPALAERLGYRRAGAAVMFLSVPLLVGAGLTGTPLVFMGCYLVRQGLHYLQMPYVETVMTTTAPESARSTMGGYREIGFFLGSAAGAKIYGTLLAAHRFDAAFLVSAGFCLCIALAYMTFYRQAVPLNGLAEQAT